MTRHGISHGAATLVTSVAAGLIVDQVRHEVPVLSGLLLRAAYELSIRLPFHVDPQSLAVMLAATVLAVGWGMLFGMLHGRRSDPIPPSYRGPTYWHP